MSRPLLILWVYVLSSVALADTLVGVAKNKKGETVYLEKHSIQNDEEGLNKFIRVEYTKPDGAVFARMTSDFSKNQQLPETTFEDERFRTKTVVRITGDAVEFEETKNSKQVGKKTFPLQPEMVVSQGFDNFIKANAEKLATQALDFKFGVLEKKDFYSLTGYRRSSTSADEAEYGIRASNWLIRLFASELKVVYDLKRMRIKSFAGRSNILSDKGSAQDVVIHYDWKGAQ